jgi:hypothetical protein
VGGGGSGTAHPGGGRKGGLDPSDYCGVGARRRQRRGHGGGRRWLGGARTAERGGANAWAQLRY